MADFQLRGIDAAIVDKVKVIARERGWSINDVLLHLLRQALGMNDAERAAPAPASIVEPTRPPELSSDNLAQDESAALLEAIKAFESLPEDRSPFRMAGREK